MEIRNVTSHISSWELMLRHEEMRILDSFQEKVKKNESLPLDCLSSWKQQFLASIKNLIRKKGREQTDGSYSPPKVPW